MSNVTTIPELALVGAGGAEVSASRGATTRLPALDILRGVAILLVLASHPPLPQETGAMAPLSAFLQRIGWTGVDLFFVLSGFLIGGLLFKEIRTSGKLDLPRFFIRRGFKIWPSYYLLVLAAVLLMLVRTHGHIGASLRTMLPNFFHIQNYWPGERPLRQTWSLAVEEHFYLALPILLWFIAARQKRLARALSVVPIVCACVCVFCLLFRWLAAARPQITGGTNSYATHLRLDSLAFGVLIAYCYHFAPRAFAALGRHASALALAGLLLISPMLALARNVPFVWAASYTLVYAGYGCLLIALLHVRTDGGFAGRVLASSPARVIAWIGTYSYPIYIWMAMFAGRPVQALFHKLPLIQPTVAWSLSMTLYIPLAIAAGVVGGKLVDGPMLALRDRLFPAHATALR